MKETDLQAGETKRERELQLHTFTESAQGEDKYFICAMLVKRREEEGELEERAEKRAMSRRSMAETDGPESSRR